MRFINIILISVIMVVASGCDYFRILAGRPTSADIQAKKLEIERVEAEALKARLDSIERVRAIMMRDSLARMDSLAVVDSIVNATGPIQGTEKYKGLVQGEFKAKFYITVGAFRSKANAQNFRDKVERRGYDAQLFCFASGWYTVGILPSDSIREIQRSLKTVEADYFFPKGAWVLMNDMNE